MQNQPVDPWLAAYQLSVFLASVIVWVQLFARWRRRGVILDHEPRRQVPWSRVAVVAPIAFMLMALLAGQPPEGAPAINVDASTAIGNLVASMCLQVLLAVMVVGIAVISGATAFDLGLPSSPGQLAKDVGLGVATCLAAVAPVHIVQLLLLSLMGQEEPSHHPLVKMLTSGDVDYLLLIVASTAAVVAAPLCEEIIYRLMLQGWLERWEVERARSHATAVESAPKFSDSCNDVELNNEARMTNDQTSTSNASNVIRHSASASNEREAGIFGLPFGWFPILVSSTLFAAAHAGYGPEPVPIFLLALILGYVYQRTHRIVPTIVAHALFNLITMITLWRLVFNSAE
jgi:membrane protease YdiL (CAAX protease family)